MRARSAIATAVLVLAVGLWACPGPRPGPARDKPLVVVSLPPLAWMVERLVGERVDLRVVLPPAAAPEGWSPTPTALLAVAEADLYFGVGHPAIAFEERLIEQASSAGVATLALIEVADAGALEVSDPHLWLDPELMAATARELAATLGALVPAAEAGIGQARDELLVEIETLDSSIRASLTERRRDFVVVQHAAWARLLERYGVSEEAIEQEGKEPEPGRMVEVVELARASEVPTVFTQRGLADRSARLIAGELGAEVVALDPLARDWAQNLAHTAGMFAAAVN